jgi:hypothetical protein
MIGHRCKNCTWWDNTHISVKFIRELEWKPTPGFCRRRKAGVIAIEQNHVAIHPVQDADEFCGEFKGDE